jgi:hypothetical protein
VSESPIGAAAADAPLGRVAVGGLGRLALAGLVLVLAAVVVTMSGGAGLGARLGALFGLHSERRGAKPVSAINAAPPAPTVKPLDTVARGKSRPPARSAPTVRLRSRYPAGTGPQRTLAPSPRPGQQAPPAVPPPPTVPSPPRPAPPGTVQRLVTTVRDTTAQVAPAPAQAVVDQATEAVNQVCGLAGGCP